MNLCIPYFSHRASGQRSVPVLPSCVLDLAAVIDAARGAATAGGPGDQFVCSTSLPADLRLLLQSGQVGDDGGP